MEGKKRRVGGDNYIYARIKTSLLLPHGDKKHRITSHYHHNPMLADHQITATITKKKVRKRDDPYNEVDK